MYVLAALACQDARSEGDVLNVVGAFNAFPASSFPARLSPFKLVVRLVWDAGEHGRFVVGLRLVNAAAEDLIDPKTMGFTFEPADVEDLTGRTIIVGIPSLRVSGPGMMFGLVSVNDREVARVPISVRLELLGGATAGG